MKKCKFYPFNREFNRFSIVSYVLIVLFSLIAIIFLEVDIFVKIFFLGAMIIAVFLLQLVNYAFNKNACSLYIKISKDCIVKGYGMMLFKTFSREKYNKITFTEYINYPMICTKRRYSSWREIKVEAKEDVEQIIYEPIFILYKDYFLENFTLDLDNHPCINQDCFDFFVDKIMNENIILLSATYENYMFLRNFYKAEEFKASLGKAQELLFFEEKFAKEKQGY